MKLSFEYKLKTSPAKYKELIDKMEHRFPQDAPVFGKPNVIINPQQLEYGKYINMALSCLNPSELIDLAENYCGDLKAFAQEASPAMKRIFEKLEREKNENEYNRTEVQ